jgi:hypothetical protein
MVLVALCALPLAGCPLEDDDAEPAPPWVEDVEGPLPEWLSEVGLYADLTTRAPAAGVEPYEPVFPLWSSGAAKERLIYLPPGAAVDTQAIPWRFPVGTVLSKTFVLENIEGRSGEVAVETRLLFKRESGWDYALYRWDRDGGLARRMPEDWEALPIALDEADGTTRRYTLPGKLDCRGCHDARPAVPVLGYDAMQQGETAVEGRTPEETAAMGYLVGNCVHCHHGEETGFDNVAFSLLPEDLVDNTVGVESMSSASGVGVRIVPGDPEASGLYQAVVQARRDDYEGTFKPMPPLGIDIVDDEAERVLRAWIESL